MKGNKFGDLKKKSPHTYNRVRFSYSEQGVSYVGTFFVNFDNVEADEIVNSMTCSFIDHMRRTHIIEWEFHPMRMGDSDCQGEAFFRFDFNNVKTGIKCPMKNSAFGVAFNNAPRPMGIYSSETFDEIIIYANNKK